MSPRVLTYRHNGEYTYIDPAKDLDQAILFAQEAFPELKDVAPSRIAICVNGNVANNRQHIRISARSWPTVLSKLHEYEILDVLVRPSRLPEIVFDDDDDDHDSDDLPNYEDVKEKSGLHDSPAPSPSSSPRTKSLSLETIRAASRYPNERSRSRSRSKSPGLNSSSLMPDWAKGIFSRGPSQ